MSNRTDPTHSQDPRDRNVDAGRGVSWRCGGLVSTLLVICLLPGLAFGQHSEVAEDARATRSLPQGERPDQVGQLPEGEQGVGVDEHTGVDLPLDLTFTDDEGSFRRLGDFFDGERPVMLSLNYSDCPMLCSVQWNNMVNTLKDIGFQPGQDFEILSVSLDPTETVAKAHSTKDRYVALYNIPESADGWHFLVGTGANVGRLADTIGFKYKRLPNGHYSHPPLFVLCSPGGRVVRYVHGLKVEPDTLQKALIESAEGKIGSPINQFVFACYQYNVVTGKYTPNAMFLMKLGGAATVVVLVATLLPFWFSSRQGPAGEKEQLEEDLIDLV